MVRTFNQQSKERVRSKMQVPLWCLIGILDLWMLDMRGTRQVGIED